jgi:putative sigma-54 modulation protein
MEVTFSGKSVQITEREREYAHKKLQRLARYFRTTRDAHLVYSVQRNWQIVEVQLDLDGVLLRAEERTADFFTSVDGVVDKLEHQVKRFKGKITRHKGRADAPTVANVLAELPEEEPVPGEPEAVVVRRKRIAIKPMSAEEASLQMELLHHDFFAFVDSDTQQVGVLYRRRDGNYGLLELDG